MKKISLKKLGLVFTTACVAGVMAFALAGCGGGSSDNGGGDSGASSTLRFVTGGEAGTYYAFGSVIAQHATNEAGVEVTALSSEGSKANVIDLADSNAELGFCQSDVMSYAYEGTNVFADEGAVTNFSTLGTLYEEQVQIVTCDPDIKSPADLKGKAVSVGAANSGTYFNAVDILGAYGLTVDDIDAQNLNFADSTEGLQDGKIDAAFVVAGAPTTSIETLSASKTAYLVALDDEHVDALLKASPYYSKATIPAGTYGLKEDVTTVSVGAVVIVRDDVPEDAVYALTADIFDNAANLTENHAKYAEVSVEKGASVTTVPYHAGAAKYFKEKGIEVPTK
ncbi:MAG: TAXI family TRAP transporter solute-binding subunit [Coriobacteriia bacterium]|nr:TAXI family TRAP transporter solute-binding subunit [Coriobacteriia bacterium]